LSVVERKILKKKNYFYFSWGGGGFPGVSKGAMPLNISLFFNNNK